MIMGVAGRGGLGIGRCNTIIIRVGYIYKTTKEITFALKVRYKGNITQNFRKPIVQVPTMENIAVLVLSDNARAECCQVVDNVE